MDSDRQFQTSPHQRNFDTTITCPHQEYYDQAIEIYSEFLDSNAENLTALLGLFNLSRSAGHTAEIKHYLKQYLKRHPGDITIMHCLASVFIMENRLDAAREVLLDILVVDSRNVSAAEILEEIDHIEAQVRLESAKKMWLVPSA